MHFLTPKRPKRPLLSAHGDTVPQDTPVVLEQRAHGVDGHEGLDGDLEPADKR